MEKEKQNIIDSLNKKLYAYIKEGNPQALNTYEEIIKLLKKEDSIIIQAIAMFNQYWLALKMNKNLDNTEKFTKSLELFFKSKFSDFYKSLSEHPNLSIEDLKTISKLESQYGTHDFVIWLDCTPPMFVWTDNARKIIINFLKENKQIKANFSFLLQSENVDQIDFNSNFDELAAKLQLMELPKTGVKYDLGSYFRDNRFSSLNYTGFRKTIILIINDTQIEPKLFNTIDSKLESENYYNNLIKIHALICGNILNDEAMESLKILTSKTGGLILEIGDIASLGKIIPNLILSELGIRDKITDKISINDLFQKEVKKLWQKA